MYANFLVKQSEFLLAFFQHGLNAAPNAFRPGADFCGVFLHGSGAVGLCRAASSTSQVGEGRGRSHPKRGTNIAKHMKTGTKMAQTNDAAG